MEHQESNLGITINFQPSDYEELSASGLTVPDMWSGHGLLPARGDVLRFGRWESVVVARVWSHDGEHPQLTIDLSELRPRSDVVSQ